MHGMYGGKDEVSRAVSDCAESGRVLCSLSVCRKVARCMLSFRCMTRRLVLLFTYLARQNNMEQEQEDEVA